MVHFGLLGSAMPYERALLVWLAASAIAPCLHLDRWPLAMLLTYPPRLPYAAVALVLAMRCSQRRQPGAAIVGALTALVLVATVGWGGATLQPARAMDADAEGGFGPSLSLLAFNVHNQVAATELLRELVEREHVDIMSLQEVRVNNRKHFVEALPEFAFFWAERSPAFNPRSTGVFASMIAIRRERLDRAVVVKIASGITGYRTFAIRAQIDEQPLWIVGVHATKPFWLEEGLYELLADAPSKARWHHRERDRLLEWIAVHADAPVVLAGDFNAPLHSHNMRLAGLHDAHRDVGRGPHLTVPAAFPLWGIDHVLGDARVQFSDYRTLEGSPSDHRVQLARFRATREH
jgi:endonuclease/exonuclease/phosphatase (EEP) superfamily protein YafD